MIETAGIAANGMPDAAVGEVPTNANDRPPEVSTVSKANAPTWAPDHYAAVVREAMPLLLEGASTVRALEAAQNVLPPTLRKPSSDHLSRATSSAGFRWAFNEVRSTLSADDRSRLDELMKSRHMRVPETTRKPQPKGPSSWKEPPTTVTARSRDTRVERAKLAAEGRKTKVTSNGAIQWSRDDYARIAKAIVPLLLAGEHPIDALKTAQQQCLPLKLHRTGEGLHHTLHSTAYKRAMAPLREGLTPEQLHILDHPKRAELSRPDRIVRWTPIEYALVARRVKHWQIDLQDKRSLYKLVRAAQAIELPHQRHRGDATLSVACGTLKGKPAQISKLLAQGLQDSKLIEHIPFDATRTTFVPNQYELPPEATTTHTPAKAARTPTKAPEPAREAPRSVFEFREPTEPPIPAAPPAPLSASVQAFGVAFGTAMAELVRSAAKEMVSELEQHLTETAGKLMAQTMHAMRKDIAQMVHASLEQELGPMEPLHTTTEDGAEALQIDIVGLIGPQVTEVKTALNGYADSVRFIEADHVDSWTPRRTVLLNTKFIGHNAEGKCRKHHVKPIRFSGGAGAAINAVRTLYESEGIALQTQH